jgi:hypothetical protein
MVIFHNYKAYDDHFADPKYPVLSNRRVFKGEPWLSLVFFFFSSMGYYHELIQTIRYPKGTTILSAAVASIATLYLFNRILFGKSADSKDIPVPKGGPLYFGINKQSYK